MITNIFSPRELESYSGVTNVIQNADDKDILLMPCSSKEQLDGLIEKNLKDSFVGLLISPFEPNRKINFKVIERAEIKSVESDLIDHYYPHNENVMFVGVTGTNGKTSVAWLFSEVAKLKGKRVLYMGTPGVFLSGNVCPEKILTTTPSYLDLRKLSHIYRSKFDAIVLEVSSHALAQERLKQVQLKAGAWTNFTQDHLDFHKTMEEYFEAKRKIVSLVDGGVIVIPCHDEVLSPKLGKSATKARPINSYSEDIPSVFKSGFTRDNLEVALSLFERAFECELNNLNLDQLTLPPGRFQVVEHKKRTFIVDYAHTPDALVSLLTHVREIYPNQEVITVFGCGGDRDRSKRPLMGKAAESGSDKIIVTSDNPRSEDPMAIIEDVLKGTSTDALFEIDRRLAVKKAYDLASESTVIVIAGKGHEDYQEINGVRHKLSDFDIIEEI